jgi:hypothetical protein
MDMQSINEQSHLALESPNVSEAGDKDIASIAKVHVGDVCMELDAGKDILCVRVYL